MFQTKVVKKIKTHFIFNNVFSENRAVYEIKWKNMVEADRPQMTIGACVLHAGYFKATETHSEYVVLIAFPWQQWLSERASMLHL
jgi:hypothetical protein